MGSGMTVFHRKWKFIFDWQLIDASAAIQNDFRGKDCLPESRHIYPQFPKRSLSVDVIFLSLESGFSKLLLCYGTISAAWLQKAKKEENSEDKKRVTEETRCSLAASDKGSYSVPLVMAVRPFQSQWKYRSEQAKYP